MSAFEHHQTVMQSLAELKQRLAGHGEDASAALDRAHSSMAELLQLIPSEERTSPASTLVADKVFSIPELCERILCGLDIVGVLRAHQVNHQFFDSIQDSPKLQRRMGLAPDNQHDFRLTLKYKFPGLDFSTDTHVFASRQAKGDNILVRAELHDDHDLPKLGERVRSILICQPPLKAMKASAGCCSHRMFGEVRWRQFPVSVAVTSDTGITLGDVINAGEAIQRQHATCPRARPYQHDADGNVAVSVTFEGVLPVADTDRTLLKKRRLRDAVWREARKGAAQRARLAPYIAAKLAAHRPRSAVIVSPAPETRSRITLLTPKMHGFSDTQSIEVEVQALAQATNDHVLVCEQKHRDMTQKLDKLTTLISTFPESGAQSAAYLIASLQTDIASLEEFRTNVYNAIPPAYRQSENGRTLVKKTLAIPELFEPILLQLDVPELLTAQRVSSSFCDAIEGSVVIQRKLGLLPADASQPITFPTVKLIRSINLWVESFDPDSSLDQVYTLSDNEVFLEAQWRTAQKFKCVGSTIRKMLVCQPPVRSMDVYASCCEESGPRVNRRLAATLDVATGITIGHMVDTALQVVKEHELCIHAELSEHGKDGYVRPRLTLETIIQVPDSEPLLLERRAIRESDNDWADVCEFRSYGDQRQ